MTSPTTKKRIATRLNRLFCLLTEIENTRHGLNLSEYAKKIHVSTRTLQRDIKLLRELDNAPYPIEEISNNPEKTSHTGTYKFTDGFSLRKWKTNEDEEICLLMIQNLLRTLGPVLKTSKSTNKDFLPFVDNIDRLAKNLAIHNGNNPFFIKVPLVALPTDDSIIKQLKIAIQERRVIKIDYASTSGAVTIHENVHPLKMCYFNGFWYLLTDATADNKCYKFRLERIKTVEINKETFTPTKDINTLIEKSNTMWFSSLKPTKATLEVEARVAHYFKQKDYFFQQKILKEYDNGKLLIECGYTHELEILPVIRKWIPDVRIIKPLSLKKVLLKQLKEYIK